MAHVSTPSFSSCPLAHSACGGGCHGGATAARSCPTHLDMQMRCSSFYIRTFHYMHFAAKRPGKFLLPCPDVCEYRRSTLRLIDELSSPQPGSAPLAFESQYNSGRARQFAVCLWKSNTLQWRSPQYNSVRQRFYNTE